MTNKVILIGNLTRDPEIKTMANGATVAQFSIAVQRGYTTADGERETDFFQIVAWRGLADNIAKYVKKGNKICVSGSLQTRTYEDKNGTKRTLYEVLAQDVEFLHNSNNESNVTIPSAKTTSNNKGGSGYKSKTMADIIQNPADDEDLPF